MSRKSTIGVPAGWYADPADPRAQRWWSGAEWTDHVHVPETEPAPASASTPASTSAAGTQESRGRHVSTEMTLSISSFVAGRYPRHRREVTAVA